jgi:hypothetical protein
LYDIKNSKSKLSNPDECVSMTKLKTYQRRGGNVDEDPIFQGLKKKHKCKLCEQEFFVDELPGAISYKAVLDLRERYLLGEIIYYSSWMKTKPNQKKMKMPAPSLLYQKVKLCVFCSQFFEHKVEDSPPPTKKRNSKRKIVNGYN